LRIVARKIFFLHGHVPLDNAHLFGQSPLYKVVRDANTQILSIEDPA
jgi:hypothetical protein